MNQADPSISNNKQTFSEQKSSVKIQLKSLSMVTIHIAAPYKATYYDSSGVCYTHPRGWLQIVVEATTWVWHPLPSANLLGLINRLFI